MVSTVRRQLLMLLKYLELLKPLMLELNLRLKVKLLLDIGKLWVDPANHAAMKSLHGFTASSIHWLHHERPWMLSIKKLTTRMSLVHLLVNHSRNLLRSYHPWSLHIFRWEALWSS